MTHVIETPGCWAIAPVFGGADRHTLYLLVADTGFERVPSRRIVRADRVPAGRCTRRRMAVAPPRRRTQR